MKQQLTFPRESASSLLIELTFNPGGYKFESVDELRSQAHGSAFVYSLDDRLFLVTARHNLTGRHPTTGEPLGAWHASPTHIRSYWLSKPPTDDGWPLTVEDAEPGQPLKGSGQILMQGLAIPLISEDLKPTWYEHPQFGGEVDVAVIRLPTLSDDLYVVPWDAAAQQAPDDDTWVPLAPGQDVMVLGYPYKLASGPLFPLWTRGSIASHPQMGYEIDGKAMPVFLIDARTRKGQSGSAVIRHRSDRTVVVTPDGTIHRTMGPSSQLLGVYSGRTSDESDLGFVWMLEHVDVICRDGVVGTGTF